jgi:hypothetical protein
MTSMYRAAPIGHGDAVFQANMQHREIAISFQVQLHPQETSSGRTDSPEKRSHDYSIVVSLLQPVVIRYTRNGNLATLVLDVETPPKVFQEMEGETTHRSGDDRWSRRNARRRQTDIIFNTRPSPMDPIMLKKTKTAIDFGGCWRQDGEHHDLALTWQQADGKPTFSRSTW